MKQKNVADAILGDTPGTKRVCYPTMAVTYVMSAYAKLFESVTTADPFSIVRAVQLMVSAWEQPAGTNKGNVYMDRDDPYHVLNNAVEVNFQAVTPHWENYYIQRWLTPANRPITLAELLWDIWLFEFFGAHWVVEEELLPLLRLVDEQPAEKKFLNNPISAYLNDFLIANSNEPHNHSDNEYILSDHLAWRRRELIANITNPTLGYKPSHTTSFMDLPYLITRWNGRRAATIARSK